MMLPIRPMRPICPICPRGTFFGRYRRIPIALLALAVLFPQAGRGDEPVAWLTGPELNRQLQSGIRVTWSENPLRSALTVLSRTQRVAILLDRRVDPDQKVDITSELVPLEDFFTLLAARLNLGVCYIGPVVYFGPREITTKLPTLLAAKKDDLEKFPIAVRRKLLHSAAAQWPMLTTPRELIEQVSGEMGVQVAGVEQFPHDLWDAGDLPPTTAIERLSLILAGFDLTFALSADASQATLVPIAGVVSLERSYNVGSAARVRAAELGKMLPDAKLRVEGNSLIVVASLEDHDAIRRLLEGKSVRRTVVTDGERVYTLKVEAKPVGAVLKYLAQQLKLELEVDPRDADKLEQIVSFEVQEASLDQLLTKALAPAGLTYTLSAEKLTIRRAD